MQVTHSVVVGGELIESATPLLRYLWTLNDSGVAKVLSMSKNVAE